jgi:hypothetical protein
MADPFIIAEDLALKTYLQGMVVSDERAPERPVKVWFGYPDVEIRAQEFPFVTIDLIDISPANDRQTSGKMSDPDYRGTIPKEAGITYVFDIPVAYDLVYQVTTYARNPRHDRAILYQMFNKFPSKYGKLPVPNQIRTEVGYRSMFMDGFVKRDAVDGETGNRRMLRNVYTVRVVSEMTPATAANKLSSVESIVINLPENNSYIPSVYEIL